MKEITLQIQEDTYSKFIWFINQFSKKEIVVLEQSKYISDDTYLRNIDGMVESIQEARDEPINNGVTLDKLEW